MLIPKCPSCGHNLAEIELPFEKEKDKICGNIKFTQKQKNELISKLLDDLNITKWCCRMRVISYVDLAKIIL
jgi:DNA-directed RNA polymerase subunit N (RpoN/RPB10)